MTKPRKPAPPAAPPAPPMTAEATTWRDAIATEYGIADPAGALLLDTLARAFDRMRAAQASIADLGAVVVIAGVPKANPAVAIERDSRAGMLAALKALRLDLEPPQAIGRPPGVR